MTLVLAITKLTLAIAWFLSRLIPFQLIDLIAQERRFFKFELIRRLEHLSFHLSDDRRCILIFRQLQLGILVLFFLLIVEAGLYAALYATRGNIVFAVIGQLFGSALFYGLQSTL